MTVRSGFVKHKRYHTNDDYTKSAISEWTREETVEMNDGTRTLNDIMDAEHNKLNYGNGTIAGGNNQVVTGKYNIADNNNEYARITGGGTADNARSNIETLDWQGNVKFAGTITTGNNINLNDVLLLAHPVGSYYWSSDPTNPSQLFGGRWTPVKNKFIYALGDGQQVGTTGGSEYTGFSVTTNTNGHNLTENELPMHHHKYNEATAVENHPLSESEIPSHTHQLGNNAIVDTGGSHKHKYGLYVPTQGVYGLDNTHEGEPGVIQIETIQTDNVDMVNTDENPSGTTINPPTHSHTLSGTTEARGGGSGHTHGLTRNTDANTGDVGGGAAHSHPITVSTDDIPNMPPFEMAYCWRRTA